MDTSEQLSELTRRIDALEATVTRRLVDIEERVSAVESAAHTDTLAGVPARPSVRPPPPPSARDAVPPSPPPPLPPPIQDQPAMADFDVELILRWVGVALVTLAGVFLVSTAVTRGWIGPELQLIAAALGGLGLLSGSVYLADSRRPWALALGGGGSIVLIASAVASHQWKMMVEPEVSLVLVGLALALCVGVAMFTRFDSVAAVAGLATVYGPLETLNGMDDRVVLGWALALLVGATALGLIRRWPATRLVVSWGSAVVLAGMALVVNEKSLVNTYGYPSLVLAALALWFGPVLADARSEHDDEWEWRGYSWKALDQRSVGIVPAWVFVALAGLIDPDRADDVGLIALAVGGFFAAATPVMWARVPKVISTTTFLGASGVIAVGFALFLDAPVLMVALAAQAVTSYYVGRTLDDLPTRIGAYLLAAISTAIAVYHMGVALDEREFDGWGVGVATLVVVLLWVGAALASYAGSDREVPFEGVLGAAWLLTMLWIAAALVGLPEGLGLISAAWAVMACAGLVVGLSHRIDSVRVAGLLTLGVTLVKLLTVDLAEVDVLARVAIFFVVGVGLIVLGLKIPALVRSSSPD